MATPTTGKSRVLLVYVIATNVNDVEIDRIEYRPKEGYSPAPYVPAPFYPAPSHNLQPVYNPRLPFTQKLSGGLSDGLMIYISGRPQHHCQEFTINLLSTGLSLTDIAFHFGVRIKESVVVRNSQQNQKWGAEERTQPYFPFYPGSDFDLIIRVQSNCYMIAVNGQHFAEFKHRIPHNFVNGLSISGDVVIASIRFS